MGSMDPNYYDAETGRLIDLDVLRGLFNGYLDDANDPIESGGVSLAMSVFLKAADEGAYNLAFNSWADSEVREGRLSVGPPEVEWSVAYTVDKPATSPVQAARMAAAELAGSGKYGGVDGYAWRGVFDVTGPDGTEHRVDLEEVGSGRVCATCGHVDDEESVATHGAIDDGECPACGSAMVWPGHPVPAEPGEEFTCDCGDQIYPLARPVNGDASTWCHCGRRIDDQRAAAQARKDAS